ncbi:MAG: putative hydrolase of the superfamily [Actinomycetota bacterium]|jgi:putative hydrolase of the HAD superfamily|nr:putative hydrolase of the superfamily [Actinomycetota bacterium]
MTADYIGPAVIAAVTVDLDDTLFPQSAWLAGAWSDVATAAATFGLDGDGLLEHLIATGSPASVSTADAARTIAQALGAIGVSEVELPAVAPGVMAAFLAHAPSELECFPGVEVALSALRSVVPVACITDGDPHVQRTKLRALGLSDSFDAVVFSEELAPAHEAARERALQLLGVDPAQAIHVGAASATSSRARRWQVGADPAATLRSLTELARA